MEVIELLWLFHLFHPLYVHCPRQCVSNEPRAPDFSWCYVRRAPDLRTMCFNSLCKFGQLTVELSRQAVRHPLKDTKADPTNPAKPLGSLVGSSDVLGNRES